MWVRPGSWTKEVGGTADRLKSLGITDVYLVANDAAAWKGGGFTPFATPERLAARLARCKSAGIRAHVMTWIVPGLRYTTQLLEYVNALACRGWDGTLQLDAEESWCRKSTEHGAVTERLARSGHTFEVTTYPGILRKAVVETLVALPCVSGVALQAYATSSSGTTPGGVQLYAGRVWRSTQATAGKRLIVGLPLYRQSGIKGFTAAESMDVQYRTALSLAGCRGVSWWASDSVRPRSAVARFLAQGV
jgi:hypothetical protein